MKNVLKMILATSSVFALSASAHAASAAGDVYGKIGGAVNLLDSFAPFEDLGSYKSNKKPGASPSIFVGVGYHITPEFRTEFVIENRFASKQSLPTLTLTFPTPATISGFQVDTSENLVSSVASDSFTFSNKVKSLSGMLYAAYDFSGVSERLVPYITAGVGLARNKISTSVIRDGKANSSSAKVTQKKEDVELFESDRSLAYSAGVGTKVIVSDQMAVDFAYNYLDSGSIKKVTGSDIAKTEQFKDSGLKLNDIKFKSHQFKFAVIYKF